MAACDYRSCDVCGGKAFYDANLYYDDDKRDEQGNPKLGYVASMAVVCDKCAETHVAVVIERRLLAGSAKTATAEKGGE